MSNRHDPDSLWDQDYRTITHKQPAPVDGHICNGCTTPAIMCPNGNEPKDKVTECTSKNTRIPEAIKVVKRDIEQAGKVHRH